MAIGSVQLGGQRTNYVQGSDGVSSGVAKVGEALGAVAARLKVDEEKLRLEAEAAQQRTLGLEAATRWTEKQGEWSRSQIDYINNAPANGVGLTEKRFTQLRADRDAFLETLPEALREEYRLKTEATLQDFATNTFSKEYELQFNFQTDALTKSAGTLAGAIRGGQADLDAALAEFDETLGKSNLPEVARKELRDKAEAEFASAQFAKEIELSLKSPRPAGSPDSGQPVLSGASPQEVAFLNTIAVDESGGVYNRLVGGGSFNSYADHPRQFFTQPDGSRSSAAGRYQFTASTWDDLVRRYGREMLPDFSPASQDRAALLLAKERYNSQRAPNSRTFGEIIANGTDEELLQVKRVLAGTGKATTWQAFQKMSDEKFLAFARGQRSVGTGGATIPNVWTDPRFANVPYDQKLRLAGEAEQTVSALQAQAALLKKQNADMLRAQIAAGEAGLAEVNEAIAQDKIPLDQVDSVLKLVDGEIKASRAAAAFADNLSSGVVMEDSAENRTAAFKFMKDQGMIAGLQEQSPQAAAQISALFAASGVMPKEVSGILGAMSRSSDPRQIIYAMETLSSMRAKNADMFAAAFSKELVELEGVWATSRKYAPMGDVNTALEQLKNFRDPAQAAVRETMRKEAVKQLEKISDSDIEAAFDPGIFTAQPGMPISPQQRGILRSDFNKLYETYYPLFGDQDATTEFVVDQMRHSWGPDEVTGANRLMYLGPTSPVSGYAPIDGSYEWLRQDLLEGMGWDDNVEFDLIADPQTEAEIASGQKASYVVLRRGDDGQFRMEYDGEGLPLRIRFSPSASVVEESRDRALERHLEERLSRLEREVDTRHPDPAMHKLGDQAAIEATKLELEELRQRRKAAKAAEPDPIRDFEQNYNFNGDQ